MKKEKRKGKTNTKGYKWFWNAKEVWITDHMIGHRGNEGILYTINWSDNWNIFVFILNYEWI